MNKQLEKYVEDLSKKDKKTLEQKALKCGEENGELADKVLAYVSAPQSLHKVVTKQEILEESVDLTLTAMSIPMSMGFTFDDFYEMMEKKCNKWAELQSNEQSKTHMFEIHVYAKVKAGDTEGFRAACKEIGVKPIVVENEGVKRLDVMTSSRHYGNFNSALGAANVLKIKLEEHGIQTYRTKLETIPSHPASKNVEDNKNGFYMEAHLQVFVPDKKEVEPRLKSFLRSYRAHLSKNPFKRLANGYVQMITLREKCSTPVFEGEVIQLYEALLVAGFQVMEKPEIEFCIFDDNPNKKNF